MKNLIGSVTCILLLPAFAAAQEFALPGLAVIQAAAKQAAPIEGTAASVPAADEELEAIAAVFWGVAKSVRTGGAHPEMNLQDAMKDFIRNPYQLQDGFRMDEAISARGYKGSFEIRVSLKGEKISRPGAETVQVKVVLESLSFTAKPDGTREYHDGECSSLEITFKASKVVRPEAKWDILKKSIKSDYMEG